MKLECNLKGLLSDKKMSQKELSELTGIRAATIHNMYHNREKHIPLVNAAAICRALDCQINELYLLKTE